MRSIPASAFKTNCLRLMDEVAARREPVVITKRGRPVAKLVPADSAVGDLFGSLAGVITICGDIESPVDPPEAWKALR